MYKNLTTQGIKYTYISYILKKSNDEIMAPGFTLSIEPITNEYWAIFTSPTHCFVFTIEDFKKLTRV